MLLFQLIRHANLSKEIDASALPAHLINREITGICDDTRLIQKEKTIFSCTPQAQAYLELAIEKKPALILLDQNLIDQSYENQLQLAKKNKVPFLLCKNFLETQGKLISEFYQNPSHKLQITGITGTNGKTTIAWFIYKFWLELGYRAAMIGTLGCYWHNGKQEQHQKTGYTTPRAWQTQALLAKMLSQKIDRIAMEVSSEGLDLGRLDGIKFHTAIFTGLAHEHLDHHKSIEKYYQAKKKLFLFCSQTNGKLLISKQDKYSKRLAEEMQNYPLLEYPTQADLKQNFYTTGLIQLPEFYASNIFFALKGANLSKKEEEHCLSKFPEIPHPPGRFKVITASFKKEQALPIKKSIEKPIEKPIEKFDIFGLFCIVDYAHTPDSLEAVLQAIRKQAKILICVFGCGGNRDAKKRPLMGEIASRLSDIIFLCDDNPRQENSAKIRADIKKGIRNHKANFLYEIGDRKEAIKQAVAKAKSLLGKQPEKAEQKPVIVLVAGKGHEEYQILNDKTIPFSDSLVIETALKG